MSRFINKRLKKALEKSFGLLQGRNRINSYNFNNPGPTFSVEIQKSGERRHTFDFEAYTSNQVGQFMPAEILLAAQNEFNKQYPDTLGRDQQTLNVVHESKCEKDAGHNGKKNY